ncbi:DUF4345 domain-containing protein [Roseibium alexandrii]|uniref:DUF4345 domain-containing protein n=1 Tax=Roseibium alexandrii (strain DSM 17067 / NCIMB 14079 / DFL-11) TaxID=244592 RepID=A0A5E8H5L8_ROSAD|nr:DUF4345 domain-containing protein [Roseibium alexandrii]EEE47474.1 hypothetical protein SADFL11_4763 [Roseibium alexandrii DFL-11]
MTTQWFDRAILGVAGVTALGVGFAITVVPAGFYAAYDIALGSNPSLLNELRAPGASLTALGALILAGAFLSGVSRFSAALGATVFLAYAFGRFVSMGLDGAPHSGLVTALVVELVIGGLCLLSVVRQTNAVRFSPLKQRAA